MTNDMRHVIEPKSDQWNYDDFQAGPLTFTIESVRVKRGQEQPVEITLAGTPKFYRPCKSMARVMVSAWGPDSSKYVGRSLTLYGDPKVKWGGMEVGGIRISHMSDISDNMTMALTVTRANKKPFTVRPLEAQPSKAAASSSPPVASPSTGDAAAPKAAPQVGQEHALPSMRGTPDMPAGAAPVQSQALQTIITTIESVKGQKSAEAVRHMIAELHDDDERQFATDWLNGHIEDLKAKSDKRKAADRAVAEIPNDLPFAPKQEQIL